MIKIVIVAIAEDDLVDKIRETLLAETLLAEPKSPFEGWESLDFAESLEVITNDQQGRHKLFCIDSQCTC